MSPCNYPSVSTSDSGDSEESDAITTIQEEYDMSDPNQAGAPSLPAKSRLDLFDRWSGSKFFGDEDESFEW